ncbi:membrane protein YqaA with SNARE-associated domain [Aureibacillus halotolerans]|uniref:Membrane protein YqaA with SNARE-associated domain n=1 Tax=Aureibacillus halotolerans TaxID=1508390 RepID=A0A4R6U3L5_9BACI|nr:membrane protein YqaA with SNARE-associated domain [Aureibacillus halotolerans]
MMTFGIWGLMIHSFLDAVIFPIPAFFLQVPLSLIDPSQALWLATAGYVACLLGTPVGYFLGRVLGKGILQKILKPKWVDAATRMFEKNGEAAVLIGAFTPIPFKVFTILSGFLKFPLWKLILYAAIGRAVKFYVVGGLIFAYGQAAEGMVKGVSLYIFLIGVPLLLIGLFVKRKFMAKKQNASSTSLNKVHADDKSS